MAELTSKLESNKPEEVEFAKQKFRDQFNIGMLHYYLSTIHKHNNKLLQ